MNNQNNFKLVIIGPSGGGKGTQAKLIADKYNLAHISMGDLLREQINSKSDLGSKIEALVKAGKWVPDDLVVGLLRPRLEKAMDKGFILDGFPRAKNQINFLDEILQANQTDLDAVLFLDIRPEVILARREKVVKEGGKFQEGRSDDDPEIFKKRFQSYLDTIDPILDEYKKRGILIKINGERSVKDIFESIKVELEKHSE
jgi:adenylate kinase